MNRKYWAISPAVLILSLVFLQLFVPDASGLANNGDFGKVIARFHYVSADSNGADNFIYFVRDYYFDAQFLYDAGFSSTEQSLFAISSTISKLLLNGKLDIRIHGLVHLLFFAIGLVLGARAISGLPSKKRLVLQIWMIFVFGDIAYTAYINSFYMDAAALVGIVLFIGTGANIAICKNFGPVNAVFLAVGLYLLAGAKAQHALLTIPACLFLVLLARDRRNRITLVYSVIICLVGITMSVRSLTSGPQDYSAKAAFNTIFFKIIPGSPAPIQDLSLLGLSSDYIQYSGMHAFTPHGPCDDGNWLKKFSEKTGSGKIALFWLRRPDRLLKSAFNDFSNFLPEIRPVNLANVQRSSGLPPGSQVPSLTGWSSLKSDFFKRMPALPVMVVCLAALMGFWAILSAPARSKRLSEGSTLLILSLAAAIEVLIAVSFDAIETGRHFLLFHLLLDILAILLVLEIWRRLEGASSVQGN